LGGLLQGPVSILFAYWIGAGAWKRTVWGHPQPGEAVIGPPTLSERRGRQMIGAAVLSVVALSIAFVLQVELSNR
jgi:hypothetical protein